MAFEICIRLSKWAHILIDIIIPTMPGGEAYISCTNKSPSGGSHSAVSAGQLCCKEIK